MHAAPRRILLAVLLLIGTNCSNDAGGPAATASTPPAAAGFDPASGARIFEPPPETSGQPQPLIVIAPGGSWVEADPSGLAPLAEELAAAGAFVVTITYRTAREAAYFPTPVRDIGCGLGFAAARATEAGFTPSAVVLIGHSAGAQLAAVAALAMPDHGEECPFGYALPDRLVGLAGPYDVLAARGPARELFGPDNTDPAHWSQGDPMQHAGNRPEMDVLLVHGTADDVVPTWFSEQFAAALLAGGHNVTALYPAGVDHSSVYSAAVAGPIISAWLGSAGND
jgi:acetyl esterase/lipase